MFDLSVDKVVTVYYYIALFSTIFYIVKIFMYMCFGGDVEVHSDFTSSYETDESFGFISVQSILAFLMGFGWMGLTCIKVWGLRTMIAVLISLIFGLLLMFLSAYLMFCVKKLNKHVVKDLSKAVGLLGKAYTNFSPKSEGQIEIDINGQLSIETAFNDSEGEIKAFEQVKVTKFENNILYIEK